MKTFVSEAVVPAAGLGTRFYPATLTTPKEMLPLLTRPAIHLIMEELCAAGIKKVYLIISSRKEALRHYLTPDRGLCDQLDRAGRKDLKAELLKFSSAMRIEFIYQERALGLGHAVGLAAERIRGDSFFVVLPDWLFLTREPAVGTMLAEYAQGREMIISTMPAAEAEKSNYGILDGPFITDCVFEVDHIIEKPEADAVPSNLAISGRYILPRKIFQALEKTVPGRGGEIQLTDAIAGLREAGTRLYGLNFPERVYDLGTVRGWLEANMALLKEKGS